MKDSGSSLSRVSLWGIFLGLFLFLLVWFFFDLSPGHPEVTRMFAVAVLMAVWWVTEAVPLAVTALLPVVLFPLMGIMNGKAVSSTYFNHIIFLFSGASWWPWPWRNGTSTSASPCAS